MNRITELLGVKYPIIQGGMIWCSGWELASAVSNAGGLGVIGSGSMYPEVLDVHIEKCMRATDRPFAVNLPMLYPDIDKHIETIIKYNVPIVFTSAGNPKTYTEYLKKKGIIVVHVVSSLKFALKAQAAGVDAVVVEGFEAGGHNGRDETTSMVLTPMVASQLDIPVVSAGGIGSGKGMLAAMALGAEGVQLGSRFVATKESSANDLFKQEVIKAQEGDTALTLKDLTPVRLLKNSFYEAVQKSYQSCETKEQRAELLGRGRAKKGMFEGDLIEGELEIGQISGMIGDIKSAGDVVEEIMREFISAKEELLSSNSKYTF
ncbi:MAG: enoyl-[acyl-carrier protein] reductase II [Flavobacteriales bacterium]|jgi:enoyl-[acyl-carrier protein] reductase II